jgi:hypothetical protein
VLSAWHGGSIPTLITLADAGCGYEYRVGRLCGGALQWATLLGHGGMALLTAAMYLKAALGHRLMKGVELSQWVAAVACVLHLLVQSRSLANLRFVSGVAFWSLVLACAHLIFQVRASASQPDFPHFGPLPYAL